MFEWLFPNWTNPGVLAAVVAGRTLLNGGLTAVVARAAGHRSLLAVVAAAVTVASAAVTVLVLRGTLGHGPSLAEMAAQLCLLALAGAAVYRHPSRGRVAAVALLTVAVLALGLLMVPIYGEATVAP